MRPPPLFNVIIFLAPFILFAQEKLEKSDIRKKFESKSEESKIDLVQQIKKLNWHFEISKRFLKRFYILENQIFIDEVNAEVFEKQQRIVVDIYGYVEGDEKIDYWIRFVLHQNYKDKFGLNLQSVSAPFVPITPKGMVTYRNTSIFGNAYKLYTTKSLEGAKTFGFEHQITNAGKHLFIDMAGPFGTDYYGHEGYEKPLFEQAKKHLEMKWKQLLGQHSEGPFLIYSLKEARYLKREELEQVDLQLEFHWWYEGCNTVVVEYNDPFFFVKLKDQTIDDARIFEELPSFEQVFGKMEYKKSKRVNRNRVIRTKGYQF